MKKSLPLDELSYSVHKQGSKAVQVKLLDTISSNDIWKTPDGLNIISLVGVQKLAKKEGVVVRDFQLIIQPSENNKQQHGVLIWVGFRGEDDKSLWDYATGEASTLNTGKYEFVTMDEATKEKKLMYFDREKIDSKYRLAMADKRAYCRAVLKKVELYGVYSDVEAVDFLKGKPGAVDYEDL